MSPALHLPTRSGPLFPAPHGPPDPMTSFPTSAAVSSEFQHRTEVRALVALGPAGYSYASSVAWLAYAPWDSSFYVAAPPSSVDQILASNSTLVKVIPVGSQPFGVAVDPLIQEVYVTNTQSNNVTVINGTSQTPVASVDVQTQPEGIAFDPANGTLFVADNGSNNVTVIHASNRAILANVSVGQSPTGVAWDNSTNRIFVTNRGSGSVTVLDGGTHRVITTIAVGSLPYGIADDNLTGNLYTANEGSSNVSVIHAATATLNATVPVAAYGYTPDLQGVAYDALHRIVWVTAGSSAVAINTSLERVVDEIAYDPAGVAIDPTNGNVCVTNSANVTFGCFVFTSGWVTPESNITFFESGLSSGTSWDVTLSGSGSVTQSGTTSTIVFGVDAFHCPWFCYNYSYTVGPVSGYGASPAQGNVHSSTRADSNASVVFTANGQYLVTFSENGLPYATAWSVTLGGSRYASTGTTIQFAEGNGSYNFTVGGLAGWNASPASGSLSVNGSSANVSIAWTKLTSGGGGLYGVTFSESGLPNGTQWSVTLQTFGSSGLVNSTNGSSGPQIGFLEANGTYAYGIGGGPSTAGWHATPANGTFLVSGSAVQLSIRWTQLNTYALTFIESGLPNGTLWNVSLPGSATVPAALASTTSSITFSEPNGTYRFVVPIRYAYGVPEYSPYPSTGNITVAGGPVSYAIAFRLSTGFYPVTFHEHGLPVGTSWSVGLAGQAVQSTSTSIAVAELNGTYNYSVGAATGYAASPTSGTLTVRGAAVNVSVAFALASGYYPVTFSESGLGPATEWTVTLGVTTLASVNASIAFAESNGSYAFVVGRVAGYQVVPSSGTILVNGSAPATIQVAFNSTNRYAITFRETGLPNGTGWAVSIGSQLESSLTDHLTILEPNGTYGYLVLPVPGFTTTESGFVDVNASNQTLAVRFAPATYPVIVIEFGLPNGTNWSVTVTNVTLGINVTYSTSGSALILYLPNGTYSLSVTANGYSANVSSPWFTVAGSVIGGSPTVHFATSTTQPVPPLDLLRSSPLLWTLVVLVAILALLGASVLMRRRAARREGEGWIRELTTHDETRGPP